MIEVKEYLLWIYKKIILNDKERVAQINEKEVYWCSLGENVGDEENGKGSEFRRPVLVFKKFNNNICWGISMTSQNKENKYYFKVILDDSERSVLVSQMRLVDTKRFDEKIGTISNNEFVLLKERVIEIIKFDPKSLKKDRN